MPTPLQRALALLQIDAAAAQPRQWADALWLARALPSSVDSELPHYKPPPAHGDGHSAAGLPGSDIKGIDAHTKGGTGAQNAEDDSEKGASLFQLDSPDASRPESGPELRATRIPVPAADALPDRVAIERALRVFMRRYPSPVHRELDAAATAQVSAERLRITPVFKPLPERWFDVALVVDSSEPMTVWSDTAREFKRLLARHGAFRRVTQWSVALHEGMVHLRSGSGLPAGTHAFGAHAGRQLILVLTHGHGAMWRAPAMLEWMAALATRSIVAIVQLLPMSAWPYTTLGDATERLQSPERGTPNGRLLLSDFVSGSLHPNERATVVPILAMNPQAMAHWGNFVMKARRVMHAAVELRGDSIDAQAGPARSTEAHARVVRFRATASRSAFQLMRWLSMSALTLPVMRLVQQVAAVDPSPSVLAEVLLSGLVRRVHGNATDENAVYDFEPGVREWLWGGLSSAETATVDATLAPTHEKLRAYVQEKTGLAFSDFSALVQDENGLEYLPEYARPFVTVARDIYVRRGTLAPDTARRSRKVRPNPSAMVAAPPPVPRVIGLFRRRDHGASPYLDMLEERLRARGHKIRPSAYDIGVALASPDTEEHAQDLDVDLFVREGELLEEVVARIEGFVVQGALTGWPVETQAAINRAQEAMALRSLLEGRLGEGPDGGIVAPLLARPDSGARRLLHDALATSKLRARFTAGIWFDQLPREQSRRQGLMLLIAVSTALMKTSLKGCIVLPLHYVSADADARIDYLDKRVAAEHLVGMGIKAGDAREVHDIHRGIPCLVPLVGGLLLKGVHPRQIRFLRRTDRAEDVVSHAVLVANLLQRLSNEEVEQLQEFSVYLPGAPAMPQVAEVARRYCWSCETAGQAWLDDTVRRHLPESWREPAREKERELVESLCRSSRGPTWNPYASRWLLTHAFQCGGVEYVLTVLSDPMVVSDVILAGWEQARDQLARLVHVNHVPSLAPVLETLRGTPSTDAIVAAVDKARGIGTRRPAPPRRGSLSIALAAPRTDPEGLQAAVRESLSSMGHRVLARELGVDDINLPAASELVSSSDIVICIAARRYGLLLENPDGVGEQLSYLEFIYREALRQGKPIFAFLLKEDAQWPHRFDDSSSGRIDRFRSMLIRNHTVHFFGGVNDIGELVASNLKDVAGPWPPKVESPSVDGGGSGSSTVMNEGAETPPKPPGPPRPGPVRHLDDPQRGRWGGKARRDGRAVEATLLGSDRHSFYFQLTLRSTDRERSPLVPPFIFHLHDTYARHIIHIRRVRGDNTALLENVKATGVYCVGVQVKNAKGEWTGLEIDLRTLIEQGMPERFLAL